MKRIFRCLFKRNKNCNIPPNVVKSSHFSLTPSPIEKTISIKNEHGEVIEKNNPAYQPVIDIAGMLNEKSVKNIALTGPYGSGKSSVLLALTKDFPQHHYLHISLATLDGSKENEKKEEEKKREEHDENEIDGEIQNPEKPVNAINSNNQEDDEALNRKIEYSILQQLIYKEKTESIPQSRFKRIKHISRCHSFIMALGLLLFIIACCILLDPRLLYVKSFYTFFACSEIWKIVWDILLFAYIIFFSVYVFKKLIIKTYNNKINKFNIKDGEIDIKESSTSIFNKHLDEIIYFFEVTEYDVVLIEDLDRFNTPNIFIKLRELNYLLNESKAINKSGNRKITFIYAIRDDRFKDTSRTKFFDYIATVIPVIDASNSRDKLLEVLREKEVKNISEEVCMDLGLYIDDMRILKNIVNEFIQYSQRVEGISSEKMLAMILYKNYYPDDFAQLHNQKGIVYEVISNRVKYHNSNVSEKDEKIKKLKEELDTIINFYSNEKAKELRTVYVMKYLEKGSNIQYFEEERNKYTLFQIIQSADLFQKLENNTFKFINTNGYPLNVTILFQDIEKEVNPKYTYRQRLTLYPKRVDEINIELKNLQQEILELRTLPLHQILSTYPAEDFYKDTKGNRLIAFLIREGYIDEHYDSYISYFYPGVMTQSDKKFIEELKIGIANEYDYEIRKPKVVVTAIKESLFAKSEILNVNILDFIVENKKGYPLQYRSIQNVIKKHKKFDFIYSYYSKGKKRNDFFVDIFFNWDDFFTIGILESSQFSDINFELLLQYFPQKNIKNMTTKSSKTILLNDLIL